MLVKEREALNPLAYKRLPVKLATDALARDFAAVHRETPDKPLSERVTPTLLYVDNDRIFDSVTGTETVNQYSYETPLDDNESKAGRDFDFYLASKSDGAFCIWISPPGGPLNYDEGRIRVGVNSTVDGVRIIKSYGICHNFTSKQCLGLALNLAEYSSIEYGFKNPEDLRSQTILIEEKELDKWDLLRRTIPLPEVWEAIESGRVDEESENLLKDGRKAAEISIPLILQAKSRMELLQAGAAGEIYFNARHKITGSGCGALSSELLGKVNKLHSELSSSGSVISTKSESGNYVKNCGNCGISIESVIGSGYVCKACGGIYEGC